MITGTFDFISDAWFHACEYIHKMGEIVPTEYGLRAKTVMGMAMEIADVDHVHSADGWATPARLREYRKQFDPAYKHGFEYTYIDRMTKPVDQLAYMRQCLHDSRLYSRRIQALTWQPGQDCFKYEDQPCFQRAWLYPRKDRSVDLHINYRSWDMFKGFESNVWAITDCIDDYVLAPEGFKVNVVRVFADAPHIYEDDWEDLERLMKTRILA